VQQHVDEIGGEGLCLEGRRRIGILDRPRSVACALVREVGAECGNCLPFHRIASIARRMRMAAMTLCYDEWAQVYVSGAVFT
jgi:hypothetical protein